MNIHFVYKILPVFIFYTESKEENFDAESLFNFIFIKEKYKTNNALLQHEMQHARQFYRTFGFHVLLYLVSKKYRFYSEIDATRIQLKYIDHPRKYELAAKYIFENYSIWTKSTLMSSKIEIIQRKLEGK